MGTVNTSARVALPQTPQAPLPADDAATSAAAADEQQVPVGDGDTGWNFVEGLSAMGRSVGNTLTDAGSFVGVATHDDGSLAAGIDPIGLGGAAAAITGPSALMALGGRVNAAGATISYGENFGNVLSKNSIRVTPTLISAVLGPAVADGITMIAPNIVKKYVDTKDIKDAAAKKEAEKNNQNVKIQRAIAGGVAVGLIAGAVFLLKPDVFKKFGAGVSHAMEGSTAYKLNGVAGKLTGVLDEAALASKLGSTAVDKLELLKTVAPMAKDAVFTNRAIVASAGGLGTLLAVNAAAGEEDPGKRKLLWGLAAGAGALTLGGTWGIGKLTKGSMLANNGAGGLLAKNDLLFKPNIEWIKKYATTIAPITAVPAGTAASQYFNIVNDFDDITAARSPFRK